MAASNVKSGFGTLLKKGTTTLAEVTDLNYDGLARDPIEVTHMESPNSSKEFIGGLTDPGMLNVDLNFLPGNSTQKDLLSELFGGTPDTWVIEWSDGGTSNQWSFTAFVATFAANGPVNDRLSATASFKATTRPTFPS